jgi:octaprenyl-diphosphate synthase
MCTAEISEILHAGEAASEDEYLEIVSGKTAALFAGAARVGALVASGAPPVADALAQFGHRLGMGFQICDDILDLTAAEPISGKPIRRDLHEQKATLPLILALRQASVAERAILESGLQSPELSEEQVQAVRQLTVRLGGVDQAWRVVARYQDEARLALASVPESEARQAMVRLTAEAFPLPVLA